MPFEPRTKSTIYDDIKNNITDEVVQATNFGTGTFNDEFLDAYAQQVREAEIKAFVAELASFADLAGKEITQSDLDRLNVTTVSPAEVNEYVTESQLDELGKLVGETRFEGKRATGQVEFTTTSDSVDIPEGYPVGTEPDANGDFFEFQVDADGDGAISGSATVSPNTGQTTVTVDVIASDVGTDYNVGSDAITYMPSPNAGIEAVTNPSATSGGENRQSNASLRREIKDAVFENSGGGTADGIEGYIERNTDVDVDVGTDEFYSKQPPFVDVVVDGGTASNIKTLISESRPVGIEHNLVRPTDVAIGVTTDVLGVDVNTTDVVDQIEDFLIAIEVGGRFSRSGLVRSIVNADPDVESAPAVTTFYSTVTDEIKTYKNGTSKYELDWGPIGEVTNEAIVYRSGTTVYNLSYDKVNASDVSVEAIVGGERVDLSGSGTDYTVVDDDGDGNDDSIDLTGNTSPDDRTVLLVDYTHNMGGVTDITDDSGDTYSKGTDFAVIDDDNDGLDDTIDWSIGGSTPDDNERFEVEYNPRRSFRDDVVFTPREKGSPRTSAIGVENYSL